MSRQIDLNHCFPESPTGDRGPLPKQQQFMNAAFDQKGPPYVLYSGGMGSGKTLIGVITVLTMAFMEAGDYLICRLFNPELKLTTYKAFLDICPKELIVEHRIADQIVRLKTRNGGISNIIFRGMEEPEKHKSLTLNAAYIDEASQVSEEAFTLLQSRIRGRAFRKILCTTNPNGHSWIYRYWIKKDFANEAAKKRFFSVHAPSTENIHLPDGYVQSMLDSWSEERVKRDVMGSWDSFAGQVYGEFERAKHVIKPFAIPDEWTKFVGLDHGYRNPTAAIWCAMDYDGNVYAYREFYQSEWIIEEIIKGRKDTGQPGLLKMAGKEKLEGVWIDPSTKADRGKESDFTTYLDYLPKEWSLIPANNSVANGIDRVKQLLKPDLRTGNPRLFIFDTCENLIEQISSYRYEELTPGQEVNKNIKESPVKKDDHAVDALRYAIMSRPEEPKLADLKSKRREESTLSGSVQRELHDIKNKKNKIDIWRDYDYGKDTNWEF